MYSRNTSLASREEIPPLTSGDEQQGVECPDKHTYCTDVPSENEGELESSVNALDAPPHKNA